MTQEALLRADVWLHAASLAFYAVASGLAIFGVVLRRERLLGAALWIAGAGLLVQGAGTVGRWVAVGHGPYLTRYEILSSNAWIAVAVLLVAVRRVRRLAVLSVVVMPAALLLVALGIYSGPEVGVLPPTFRGMWLVLHVCFYFVAFGTALVAVAASVLYVARRRLGLDAVAALPDDGVLDSWAYRAGGLAFAFWGIGMLTGSIWAYYSWGSYWNWDPVETWSLVTWLAFGMYLHLRRFFGWQGTRAATLLVVCFGLALMSLFGTSLLTKTAHSEYFR